MKLIKLSLLSGIAVATIVCGAAVAMQNKSQPAANHLPADPIVSVQRLSAIQPDSAPTVARSTTPIVKSSGSDNTAAPTQQIENRSGSDSQTEPSTPTDDAPAVPILVESRYYCMEMRIDGSLYDEPLQGNTVRTAPSDVEVQMRLDTYSDGSTQTVNLGDTSGSCGVAIDDY